MPLGASRLNFLSKTVAVAAPAGRTARTVTAVNDAQIDTAQYKFGGSSYLGDGTSDYLTVDVADFGSTVGSAGDFTIECFARATNVSNKGIFHIHDDPDYNKSSGANSVACAFYGGSAQWQVYFKGTSASALNLYSSSNTTNTWYHVAVVRNSGTTYFYVDGVQQWSSADTYDYSSARYLQFGAYFNSGYSLPGNIDEFRISKTARYTTGFTPTTTPFVNDSDTLLLIHADGTDGDTVFIDDNGDRAPLGVQALGNAQIDTAQFQFGSSSLLLDGNGDYLRADQTIDGPFTMECWIRLANVSGEKYVFRMHNSSDTFSYVMGVINDKIYVYSGGTTAGTISLSANTWHHLAWSRDAANALRLYVDGVYDAARTVTTDLTDAKLYIGGFSNTLGVNGHLDEIRISNTARYTTTGSFSVPTGAFTNDSDTLCLLHFEEGADATTEIFDDNGGTLP